MMGFPGGSVVKNPPAMQELQETKVGSLGWEDSPGGGHGYPLQCSCLENPMDRRAQRATIQRVGKSQTQMKRLSTHAKQARGWEQKIWKYRDLLLQECFYESSGQKRQCLWQISCFSNTKSCHVWWAILACVGNVYKIGMHFIQSIYQVPQKASTFNDYDAQRVCGKADKKL